MARIDVYFHKASGSNTIVGGEGKNIETDDIDNGGDIEEIGTQEQSNSSIAKSAIATAAMQGAKQVLMSGVSQYGALTGNYVQQSQIQEMVSLGTTAIMMMNFPVGTLMGTLQLATNIFTDQIKTAQENRNSALLLQRSGNETLNNSEDLR